MKKVPEGQDMPDEIDFAGGVRGKYAARYREGVSVREHSAADPDQMADTHTRLGEALRQAQAFESALVAYLVLVQGMALRDAGERTYALFERPRAGKAPRGRKPLLKDKDLEERFQRLVRERDWLVHHSSFDLEAAKKDAGQGVTFRLERISDDARCLADNLLRHIGLNLSQEGLTPTQIEARTRQIIEQWSAA